MQLGWHNLYLWQLPCWVPYGHTQTHTHYTQKQAHLMMKKYTRWKWAAKTLTHSFSFWGARQRKSEWDDVWCFHLNVKTLTMKSCRDKSKTYIKCVCVCMCVRVNPGGLILLKVYSVLDTQAAIKWRSLNGPWDHLTCNNWRIHLFRGYGIVNLQILHTQITISIHFPLANI